MRDMRAAKLADLLVNFGTSVKPGDYCFVVGDVSTLPMLREVFRAFVEAGGNGEYLVSDAQMGEWLIKLGSDEQLQWPSPTRKQLFEQIDVLVSILGSSNTRWTTSLDPERRAMNQQANRESTETYFRRSGAGEIRWVISRFPTQANAQEAEMSLTDYEDFVYRACLIDEPDPVAAWGEVVKRQQGIVDQLNGGQELRVEGPGVDLRMRVDGRIWVNDDGRDNMPGGEVFTSPLEDSVEGSISFSYPNLFAGREVDGISLTFEAGKVVDAKAKKGESFLLSQIDQDEGARRVGEFALGTNYNIDRYTGDTLFDEKIGGTMHMALGLGIVEAGGENKSIIHWDFVHDMMAGGQVFLDDNLVYKDGKFVI